MVRANPVPDFTQLSARPVVDTAVRTKKVSGSDAEPLATADPPARRSPPPGSFCAAVVAGNTTFAVPSAATGTDPSSVPPELNVTVPAAAAPLASFTVAVKVTGFAVP